LVLFLGIFPNFFQEGKQKISVLFVVLCVVVFNCIPEVLYSYNTLLEILKITSDELPAQFGFPDNQND
jgi:hypothetical protein